MNDERFDAVLFTVPHSFSCSSVVRTCDRAAEWLGEALHSAALALSLRTALVRADVPRSQCDLNRVVTNQPRCASSTFWQNATSLIRGWRQSSFSVLVVDCHSFPADTVWRESTGVLYDAVVLLYGDAYKRPWNRDLLERLRATSLLVSWVPASEDNTLMLQFGYETSVLLEISESLRADQRREFQDAIRGWLAAAVRPIHPTGPR
jgi:hypothetical protein